MVVRAHIVPMELSRNALITYLENDRKRPTPSQKRLMDQAADRIGAALSPGSHDTPQQRSELIATYNTSMDTINNEMQMNANDHVIADGMLTLHDALDTSTAAAVQQSKMQFAYYLYFTGFAPLAFQMLTQLELEAAGLDENAVASEIRAMVDTTLALYQAPVDPQRATQKERSDGPELATPDPPTNTPLGRRIAPSQDGAVDPATAAPPPSTGPQTRNRTRNRTQGSLRTGGITPPPSSGAITALGEVEKVQKLAFGYRAIVNVGTQRYKVYKSIPGAEFGRGTMHDLYNAYKLEVPDKQALKDRRKAHVEKIKAVVQVEKKTTSSREPITKFLIKWREEPTEEWISRSDFMPIYGKKDTEAARLSLLEDLRHNLEYLADMKEQSRHPETGDPLDDSEKTQTPWLFPTSTGGTEDGTADRERRTNPDDEATTAEVGGTRFPPRA
ncbi:hypothetical protein LTR53_014504 [Teratosphaeriaceae sp. CCFEE 6253]|nr:hypothetical protein LTR53_014504 [Teratosphaeriaceae sp. CCFEE 6253]